MIGTVYIINLHADHVMSLPGMILRLGAYNKASITNDGSIGSTRSKVNSSISISNRGGMS